MKKLAFVLIAVLLTTMIVVVGCGQVEPAVERGTVTGGGGGSVTITTGDEEASFEVTSESQFLLDGEACTLEDILAYEGNLTCHVVYDERSDEIITIDAVSPEQYVRGRVEGITEGSIAIAAEDYEFYVFDFTPNTQFMLEGQACSIEDLVAAEGNLACNVIYDPVTDEPLLIDVFTVE